MKYLLIVKILILYLLLGNITLHAKNNIAVVKSSYDQVEQILHDFKIPHDLINCRDLENKETFNKYTSIFFPCGIDNPIEANLNIFVYGTHIKSVSLKNNFHELDKDQIADNIRSFIEKGGSAYFSGYSYEFLQKAFSVFEFFDNFPYMGLPGRIESDLKNDLARFAVKKNMALYMTHSGWISIKSAKDSELLSEAAYETPRGKRSGPISMIFKRGSGEILYTSYHSTVYSPYRRFNIYRVAGAELLNKTVDLAKKWDQHITGRIVDSIISGESHQMYCFDLFKGNNSIFFISEKNRFQIDIFDKDMSLIESRDFIDKMQIFDIKSEKDDYCLVKIYPSSNKRFGRYAFVSAKGTRLFPYYKKIGIGSLIVIGLGVVLYLYLFVFGRKYSGRMRSYY